MSNKKEWMLERLNRLVKTCKSTEPDSPDESWLFTPHVIDAHEMYTKVNTLYDSLSHEEKVKLMTKANQIWKIRRKIWNGEFDFDWQASMHAEIVDQIKAGALIQAIKHYRQEMNTHTGTQPSLRVSKDHVDKIRDNLKQQGVIK